MSRLEYLSLAGLRIDGRKPNETRRIACKLGIYEQPDGSALLEQGNTKVVACVYGPREVRFRSQQQRDRALLNVEYMVAPFAGVERRRRRRADKHLQEVSTAVKRCLQSVLQLHLYPSSQIDVFLQVVQSDGGELSAAINAASMALMDAGVGMTDLVCSCGAAVLDDVAMVDPNYMESSAPGSVMPVAMLTTSGKVTLAEMSGRISMATFDRLLTTGQAGCRAVAGILRGCLRDHAKALSAAWSGRLQPSLLGDRGIGATEEDVVGASAGTGLGVVSLQLAAAAAAEEEEEEEEQEGSSTPAPAAAGVGAGGSE